MTHLWIMIGKRVVLGIGTLFVISLIIFGAVELLPGDVAQELLGQGATEETVAALRHELGLDRPAYVRYFSWLSNALQGDFGNSLATGLFPSISNIRPGMALGQTLYLTFLPALTLTLVVTAHMMRMTRAALINLLASPYIEMANLKGASKGRVIVHHALPNALAPIINVTALNLAYLVTGVVVVEAVFVFPGLGQLMVDSVSKSDLPVVQACALIFACAYVLLNLLADVLATVTNPRLIHAR